MIEQEYEGWGNGIVGLDSLLERCLAMGCYRSHAKTGSRKNDLTDILGKLFNQVPDFGNQSGKQVS
jgi:hypothetical protein